MRVSHKTRGVDLSHQRQRAAEYVLDQYGFPHQDEMRGRRYAGSHNAAGKDQWPGPD